ncbi:PIN domain-containing protein [Kineococcus sp. SYSU DK005]|uniref:PIN domain-containing protein n=1 Tax=Kineococcus sp. SYSU DK005 TaxID=3383126 RepID=UPI003D7EE9B2
MSALVLDTNAVITIAQAAPGTRFAGIGAQDAVGVSVVTEAEVRLGVALAVGDPLKHAQRAAQLAWLVTRYRPLPVDAGVVAAFSSVAALSLASGREPKKDFRDLLIAATAVHHGAVLVTDDAGLARVASALVRVRSLH